MTTIFGLVGALMLLTSAVLGSTKLGFLGILVMALCAFWRGRKEKSGLEPEINLRLLRRRSEARKRQNWR